MKLNKFQNLIFEIHRVNKAWHCFEISNRFLNIDNKYLQKNYLKKKNELQKQLEEDYENMIEFLDKDETGNPSIGIKENYTFEYNGIFYKDACHKRKEEVTI